MINLKNLKVGYGSKVILPGIDLEFKAGTQTALLGPNGAGKTTLLKSLSGYLQAISGEIVINGKHIREYSQRQLAQQVALIPQNFQLQFEYQVKELVLMGRFPYLSYLGSYKREDHLKVQKVLEELDLQGMAEKNFRELSGGEQQRVAIARALVQETPILLMDEAFANLDVNHAIHIMQLLSRINSRHNKTIILVSHNINLAVEYCQRVVMMKEGKIIDEGSAHKVITSKILSAVYGHNIKVITNPVSGQPNLVYSSEN